MADAPSHIHIAKFLQLDRFVQKLLEEVKTLNYVSGEHTKQLKEIDNLSSGYVSHGELFAAITAVKAQKSSSNTSVEKTSVSFEKLFEISKSVEDLSKCLNI